MILVLETLVWLATAIVLVPMTVLVVECLAALLPVRRRTYDDASPRPRCAVLIPAHNEEAVIAATLASIQPQLRPDDRLVVVADNCTDQTAELARSHGATVVERENAQLRGKGFALDRGVRFLEESPPEVVVFLDADCAVGPGALDELVRGAAMSDRPLQAVYLMGTPPEEPTARQQLSAFAFQFKNQVRPLGLHRLGLPCLLTGTGMALPWTIAATAELATANIVEDMKLGLDLAVDGRPPHLCPQALVTSELPVGTKAAAKQRTRWEHGHVQTITHQVPRLLRAAVVQGRLDLLGLALEVGVPPLSLLFLLWGAALTAALGLWWLDDSPAAAIVLGAALLAVGLGILAGWAKFGRQRLPLSTLLAAPFYVLWKVPIYIALVLRPEKKWESTERRDAATPQEPKPS